MAHTPIAHQYLLENLTTAVVLLDDRLRIGYMNPSAEMLFEISLRRALGLSMDALVQDDATLHGRLQESLRSGRPFTEREHLLNLLHGREATVDLTVTPVTETHRARQLLVELVHVDRQLRISREESLLSQHAATRALVRGLAHEIKNPLGGLRGAAQLLEGELGDPGLHEYTRVIIGEADRLQSLVDRMLGPNNVPRKHEINVHEVLEHVHRLIAAEAPAGVRIDTDYDPSIPELMADRDLLVQAVLNIARNALQAVGETGHIVLRSRVLRQYTVGHVRHKLVARIQIIDDGPGIPEQVRERVFYPMVSGRPGGTGLGLSIAQSLINQHGGLIECTSQPGKTVFSILIPLETRDD
ncbi:two-component system sensor histidine kinase NtrB [Thioalkalivibrio denitrificans]|uniref:histidine kinase n=1 Tax=Thioalkalivibrio denitrificans TaxID=108003 RepID=A0A1V3NPA5_9GAMM|nr:nitrogen regulation protein NR(II) [Thioalkalivibrio denitrificans]OOG26793.1 two-component system sensor histidine kinase NtrB [Thioalkalivibrio denitrificans]